jgi:hypothetical protein
MNDLIGVVHEALRVDTMDVYPILRLTCLTATVSTYAGIPYLLERKVQIELLK